MLDDLTIGKRIRLLREQKNKSQAELGQALGKTHAAISDIERGKTHITISDLSAISSFFGVTIQEILQEEKPITVIHNRDAKDMTPEEKQMANKVAKEFIKYARELAQKKQK